MRAVPAVRRSPGRRCGHGLERGPEEEGHRSEQEDEERREDQQCAAPRDLLGVLPDPVGLGGGHGRRGSGSRCRPRRTSGRGAGGDGCGHDRGECRGVETSAGRCTTTRATATTACGSDDVEVQRCQDGARRARLLDVEVEATRGREASGRSERQSRHRADDDHNCGVPVQCARGRRRDVERVRLTEDGERCSRGVVAVDVQEDIERCPHDGGRSYTQYVGHCFYLLHG